MGIPAVCGLGEALSEDLDGKEALHRGRDRAGDFGTRTERPWPAWRARQQKQAELRELMRSMVGQKDVTLDGREMMVYCNIGSPEDVPAVLANDGQGVGLFRSEFLYLATEDYPTEEA